MKPMTVEIEINEAGDTLTTSDFQLLQWKHALRLEKIGMTMSGGRKVSTHLRKLMGLSRGYPIDSLIEWVENTQAAVRAAREAA